MTRIGLQPSGFSVVDGELMVDLGLLTADLVLMADYLLFFGSGCCLIKFWVGGFWVGGLTIFLDWFSHVGLGLMNFSCFGGFGGG